MKKHPLLPLLYAAFAFPATTAFANLISYTVDPTRSSLTLSGTYAGYPLQPQVGVPNGLTTSYTGTITANRDYSADTLQITGGTISAQTNGTTSPFGVAIFRTRYFSPADYGFTSPSGVTNLPSTTFTGALVNFSFSLSGPTTPDPLIFDASQLSRNAE